MNMQYPVIQCSSIEELEKKLENTHSGLAIVFASSQLLNQNVVNVFASNGLDVFGSMSAEEIANGEVQAGTITGLILPVSTDQYALRHFETQKDSFELGRSVADWVVQQYANPVLLLFISGAGLSVIGDDLLAGIFSRASRLPVYGGLSSRPDSEADQSPPVFDHKKIYHDGVLALAFDSDTIELNGLAISGWREIGTPKRITKSNQNRVYEIEGIPAAEFYRRYFQIDINRKTSLLDASEYPIRLEIDHNSSMMRTAVFIDQQDGSVIYGGNIPQGSMVRFCAPNIVQTIQHTITEMQNFREEIHAGTTDAILLFDCAIRSRSFGSYMKKEVAAIYNLWNIPMIGFSSWGEIGNMRGQSCNLHNTVISMLTLRIKSKSGITDESNRKQLSSSQVKKLIETIELDADLPRNDNSLLKEFQELKKQKNMLSNFLQLTASDLEKEQEKSEQLLKNILPESTANRLKSGERLIADRIESVTIVFADLVGFTELSDSLEPERLVRLLNRLFSSFDEHAHRCKVEKIKTIGDAYMAVAGLPEKNPAHALSALKFANGMLNILKKFNDQEKLNLALRVGLNTGPVVAGVIGRRKFTYDIWGDTVNVASRMESHGVPGKIHMNSTTYKALPESIRNQTSERGYIEVKGKGKLRTFFFEN